MTALSLRRPSAQTVLLVVAALALLILVIEPGFLSFGRPSAPAFKLATPTTGAPLNYPDALRRLDERVVDTREQVRKQGEEWLLLERLASAHMARARLTGSFDDYASAQDALDRAFATAPQGAGPHLTQAQLAFGLHRLGKTEDMIRAIEHYAVPPEAETMAELSAMRGDLAFYRGDYATARKLYMGRTREQESTFRLAVYDGKTGQPGAALALYEAIERQTRFPSAGYLANLALARGELELQRGAWDKAAAQFDRADKVFPGNWLAAAHVAQMLALQGKRPEAIARLQAIAERSGAPEVMDALASIYRAQGDAANSRAWADRAGAIWARRLQLIPEAAWGHAIEHELAFGDPRRALEMAQKDYAARPHGGTAIALGWALIANNQPAEALKVIQPVLASAWVSPEQHLVAAQAYLLLGQPDAADREQQKALKLNPKATDPAASLIWFGHG